MTATMEVFKYDKVQANPGDRIQSKHWNAAMLEIDQFGPILVSLCLPQIVAKANSLKNWTSQNLTDDTNNDPKVKDLINQLANYFDYLKTPNRLSVELIVKVLLAFKFDKNLISRSMAEFGQDNHWSQEILDFKDDLITNLNSGTSQ
ncbi:MAG: hypothetical protein EBE86_015735 [Hormoscilla sp. GUM202]|nr:hypothetical protein [Hormoscilla sp. GUM202]